MKENNCHALRQTTIEYGLNKNINVKREHEQQYKHKHEQKICVFTTKVDQKKRNKLNATIPQIGSGQTNNIGLHSW